MTQSTLDFSLVWGDYIAFGIYLFLLSLIGYFSGRKKKQRSEDYFLAGKSLPWYVIGSSYIASNISTEHFLGLIGSSAVFGICLATPEWSSVIAFSFLIWFFIPFLLKSKVFTIPEFLEKRFNRQLRLTFAIITIAINILAFMAAVIYGGGLLLGSLLHMNTYLAIIIIGFAAGIWAIIGGLKSVAWMDLLTVVVMIIGGLTVTILGLNYLSGSENDLIEGFKIMIERNKADDGIWKTMMEKHIPVIINGGANSYNRLSVIQPLTHATIPWTHWVLSFFYLGIWYMVINQFMIQRVLGAKDIYHARMGIVFASYLKLLLPFIVVIPGLIYFALHPEFMNNTWEVTSQMGDQVYMNLIREFVPVVIRGILLAALFGAIQSTVSAVLNSTSTIFTVDIYQTYINKKSDEQLRVKIGRISGIIILTTSVLLAFFLYLKGISIFIYTQELYAFFAPPFAALFLLGTLWKRMNGKSALLCIGIGYSVAILLKVFVYANISPNWLNPYAVQALVVWIVCVVVCYVTSILTAPPRPEQITDDLTFNWKQIWIAGKDNTNRNRRVFTWWALSFLIMILFILIFSLML
ncbi:MAG: sodium/solute symporter [Bacteroidales bacterium]|nr:sodium/solute symporter [Bacteroidales bacterium]